MIKESMLESVKKHIPVKQTKGMQKLINPEILNGMEENRKAMSDEQKYKELDKQEMQ